MFVGWDWATTAHDVTVIDSAGDRVHRMAILYTEDGIARAVVKLAGYGDPGELPVAIETTRGLVVDRLLAAGHPVIPAHPNAFHAVPPRSGAARAKTDPGDSFKLPGHRLRRIHTRRGRKNDEITTLRGKLAESASARSSTTNSTQPPP